MIKRTIERMRSVSSWILSPGCLIDGFLDQIEKLNAVLVVPARDAGLSHGQARLDERFGH